MIPVGTTVATIRQRWQQLAGLTPQDRRARLAAELQDLWSLQWQGLSASEKRAWIDELGTHFPGGLEPEDGSPPAPVPVKVRLSREEACVALVEALAQAPLAERETVIEGLAGALGCRVSAGPAPERPLSELLVNALREIRWPADRAFAVKDASPGRLSVQEEVAGRIVRLLESSEARQGDLSRLARLAAMVLVELSCLEHLGQEMMLTIYPRGLDPVHGSLAQDREKSLQALLQPLAGEGDRGDAARGIQISTGLIKSLLFMYQNAAELGAGILYGLRPQKFEEEARKGGRTGWLSSDADYKAIWARYCQSYKEAVGRAEERERFVREYVERIMERVGVQVCTFFNEFYKEP